LVVDILSGNYFQCAYLGDDTLPTNDPDYKHYSCGSSSLDLALFLLSFILAVVIVGIVTYTLHHNYVCMLNLNDSFYHSYCTCIGVLWYAPMLIQIAFWDLFIYVSMLRSKVTLVRDVETLETRSLVMLYMELRRFAVQVALVLGIVVMPIYVLVGIWYSTITFQYGWVVSAGFTSGFVPAALFLVVWSGVLYVVYLCIFHIKQRLGTFHQQNIEYYESDLGQLRLGRSPHRRVYAWAHGISPGVSDSTEASAASGMGSVLNKSHVFGSETTDGSVELQTANPMHADVASTVVPAAATVPGHQLISSSSAAEKSINMSTWHSFRSLFSGCWSLDKVYLYLLVPLLNGIIVVLFNGMYVYVVITQSTLITLFAQLALVVFKTGWNQFFVPALIAYVRVIRPRCVHAQTISADTGGVSDSNSSSASIGDSSSSYISTITPNDTVEDKDDDIDADADADADYNYLDDADLFSRTTVTAANTNYVLASRFSSRWTFSPTLRDTDISCDDHETQTNAAPAEDRIDAIGGGGKQSSLPRRIYSKHYRIQVLLLMFNNVIGKGHSLPFAAAIECLLM
jgi:hypothetical protein